MIQYLTIKIAELEKVLACSQEESVRVMLLNLVWDLKIDLEKFKKEEESMKEYFEVIGECK